MRELPVNMLAEMLLWVEGKWCFQLPPRVSQAQGEGTIPTPARGPHFQREPQVWGPQGPSHFRPVGYTFGGPIGSLGFDTSPELLQISGECSMDDYSFKAN